MPSVRNILPICAALLWLCLPVSAAASLDDYARRLKDAQLQLESVRHVEDGESPERYLERIATTLADTRRRLPETETISGPDGPLKVDNTWLTEEIEAYQQLEAGSKEADRKLESIAARLSALRSRLAELPAAKSGSASKDEQKGKLDSILRRPEYNQQPDQGNAISRLFEALRDFFRRRLPDQVVPLNEEQAKKASPVAQLIVYGLIALTLGLAAWRIIPFLRLRHSRNRRRKETLGTRIILGEKLEAHQTSADIFAEAERLARQGELRAAIRKGYVALLCELGDRKAIRLEQHKTNRDYLRDVAGQVGLYHPLQFLTNRFEYHWYGLAPARQEDWDEFRARYERVSRGE